MYRVHVCYWLLYTDLVQRIQQQRQEVRSHLRVRDVRQTEHRHALQLLILRLALQRTQLKYTVYIHVHVREIHYKSSTC